MVKIRDLIYNAMSTEDKAKLEADEAKRIDILVK